MDSNWAAVGRVVSINGEKVVVSTHRHFENILVTGAGGFIGSRLVSLLESRSDCNVKPLLRSGCDLSDAQSVAKMLQEYSPDCIFHLAAVGVSHARANDSSVVDENLTMFRNLVQHCPEGTTIIVAGSMAEYGGEGKFSESDHCQPETEYGKAKLEVTKLAIQLARKGQLRICVARLFGVYGPGEASYRLFPSLINGLLANEAVELSDGKQRRDFVHVDDVCDCLWRLASGQRPLPPVVNLGCGVAVHVKDVCHWIADGLGKGRDKLGFGLRHRSPGDADMIEADTSLLYEVLEMKPPQRLQANMDVRKLFELPTGMESDS